MYEIVSKQSMVNIYQQISCFNNYRAMICHTI
jgi:hypothetical protein